jgi:hypothetical protein
MIMIPGYETAYPGGVVRTLNRPLLSGIHLLGVREGEELGHVQSVARRRRFLFHSSGNFSDMAG